MARLPTPGSDAGTWGKYAYYFCGGKCNYKCIQVKLVEEKLIALLKSITPKESTLNLFIQYMYKSFHERTSRLTKIRNDADNEIVKMKELRQVLVKKNLDGIYSDEIFKEQSDMIENKIMKAQIVKDDANFSKYNIDAVTSFMKKIFADLGETYRISSIYQLKALLGLTFRSGLSWDYNGRLDHQISPLYQAIRRFDDTTISSCADERS